MHKEVLREYRTISVREDTYEFLPSNQERGFIVCDSANWVVIIAVTVDNQVVFIRQFRAGLGDVVLELPGGVVERDETPSQCAVRELHEETGYIGKTIEVYGPLLPNPALNTACYHVVLATGCTKTDFHNPEPYEDIEVELRPLASVNDMIKTGELNHALCVAAFALSGAHLL